MTTLRSASSAIAVCIAIGACGGDDAGSAGTSGAAGSAGATGGVGGDGASGGNAGAAGSAGSGGSGGSAGSGGSGGSAGSAGSGGTAGSAGSGGNAGTSGAGGVGGTGGSAANPPVLSGTRLKAMHTTGTDGAKLYRRGELFDSQLQVACKYALAADGKLRCLPMVAPEAAEGIVYYSDNQCTKPHVWLATPPVGCPLNLPKYVYKYGAPTYCPEEPKFHVFPVEGNVVPNAVNYRIHNGVCEYISVSYVGLTAFTLKAELPSSSFVEGTPGQEP